MFESEEEPDRETVLRTQGMLRRARIEGRAAGDRDWVTMITDLGRAQKKAEVWEKQARFWEGKFHAVKRENNALRRKLYHRPDDTGEEK